MATGVASRVVNNRTVMADRSPAYGDKERRHGSVVDRVQQFHDAEV
jgi:hypothetical protein